MNTKLLYSTISESVMCAIPFLSDKLCKEVTMQAMYSYSHYIENEGIVPEYNTENWDSTYDENSQVLTIISSVYIHRAVFQGKIPIGTEFIEWKRTYEFDMES